MSTTVDRMRTTFLLLALTTMLSTALTACGGGGGSDDQGGSSLDQVEASTTERAREAIPLVTEALGSSGAEATAQWQSCMAISWRYEAFATMNATGGDAAAQLDAVRAALLGAGYEDDTQVDGHVTVTRGDTTVDAQLSPARGKGTWTVTVQSSCADYDGDDLKRVESDEARPLDGV